MENTNEVASVEAVEVKRGRGRPKTHVDVPSHLVCTVTGEKLKTNPPQFRLQVEKSGKSTEEFIKTYVSRKGRRLLREQEEAKKQEERKEVAPASESVA